jgi:hypothetical protein
MIAIIGAAGGTIGCGKKDDKGTTAKKEEAKKEEAKKEEAKKEEAKKP